MAETETGWSEMSLEHFGCLVVGAGLSGIGGGCHLQARCPDKAYTILEAGDCIGGTWDLFRYPHALDILSLRFGAVSDCAMRFARAESTADPAERLAA